MRRYPCRIFLDGPTHYFVTCACDAKLSTQKSMRTNLGRRIGRNIAPLPCVDAGARKKRCKTCCYYATLPMT